MFLKFNTAQEAFEKLFNEIISKGKERSGTKYLRNVGFVIKNPKQNHILTSWRRWSIKYAQTEWEWYLKATRSTNDIRNHGKIWRLIEDEKGEVNSNYGWQWKRSNQLEYVVRELKRDCNTRRAVLTIYDAKEHHIFKKDTPCTISIHFDIEDNKLNMNVVMRSNDLVYGFCNDQYCFSELQKLVSDMVDVEVGEYFHFCHNIHIYERHYKINER
jgi:thymidylate synthase